MSDHQIPSFNYQGFFPHWVVALPAECDATKFAALQANADHGLYIEPLEQMPIPDPQDKALTLYAFRVATDKMVDFDNLEHLQRYFPSPEQTALLLWPQDPTPYLPVFRTRSYLHRFSGAPEFRNLFTFPKLLQGVMRNYVTKSAWVAVMDILWTRFLDTLGEPPTSDHGTHPLLADLGLGWIFGHPASEDLGTWAQGHVDTFINRDAHSLTPEERLLHALVQHIGAMPLSVVQIIDAVIDPYYAALQGQLTALAEAPPDRPH